MLLMIRRVGAGVMGGVLFFFAILKDPSFTLTQMLLLLILSALLVAYGCGLHQDIFGDQSG